MSQRAARPATSFRWARRSVSAVAVLAVTSGLGAEPAAAAPVGGCDDRIPRATGTATPQVRQASGLTTTASSPGVLWTHNDRGIRDFPTPGEDTDSARLWAMEPSGRLVASIRLVTADGARISYHDTEAVSRDPQDRLVLADTGQNVDPQRVAHLYRTSVAVSASAGFTERDAVAEVIPLEYFASPSSSTPLVVNVETVFVDTAGDAWFIARSSGQAWVYVAGAADLEKAAATGDPARAVAVTRTGAKGPFTDASLSPSGDLLLLKTTTTIYAYDLVGVRTRSGIAAAMARPVSSTGPCAVAAFPKNSNPGRGEAVVVADDGSFFTLAESAKDATRSRKSSVYLFR